MDEGWTTARLGDVADIFSGKAAGQGGTQLRVFKTRHVYDGYVRRTDPTFAPDGTVVPERLLLRDGDVLTPNMAFGTIGRVGFVEQADANWTVDGQVMIVRSRSPDRVLPRYLFDWLSLPSSKHALVTRQKGGIFGERRGQTHLYVDDVASIEIRFPSLDEQRRIAAVLSAIDRTAALEREVCERLSLLRGAATAQLLTTPDSSAWERVAAADAFEVWPPTHKVLARYPFTGYSAAA